MKHHAVHHLHVKYRGQIYTILHRTDCMSMNDLMNCIREIKEVANGNEKIRA